MSSTSAATQNTELECTGSSNAASLYLLRPDERERERLLKQHQLYTRLLSDRLIIPPMSLSDHDEVLDVGTGGCSWLCDAQTHLPDGVQLYGIDIDSSLFSSATSLSANIHLLICSGTDLPSHWTSKFSLIHQRLLICAYTRKQWQRGIDEMFRVLKPGGYTQLIEAGPEWVSGVKTAAHMLFLDDFFSEKGMMMRCGVYIGDMLRVAGFVDVTYEEVVMRLGKLAGEEGNRGSNASIGALRGMRDAVMKMGGLGRFASGEEFDRAMDEIVDEWDKIENSYLTVRAFYGRKPL